MTSLNFLQSVIAWFNDGTSDRPALQDVTFVLPNKRSALFLKKYIRDTFSGPALMPRIMTAPTFVSTWSTYPGADRTELLFVLFNAYREVIDRRAADAKEGKEPKPVSFDEFIYWGDMMLNDFDDVDRSLAEASQVFKNIKDLKDIQADFLDEEQKEIVRRVWGDNRLTAPIERFWLHTHGKDGETPMRDNFVYLWELLSEIYDEYRRLLGELHRSSTGLQYRSAAEAIRNPDVRDFTGRTRYAFVGFSDLTATETVIFEQLRRHGVAYFFWDTAALDLFGNDAHLPVALQRLRRLASKFPAPEDYTLPVADRRPVVDTISVPSNVAQAKYVATLLRQLIETKQLDPDNAVNTAVILPDESLLLPLLSSIPPEITALNISMGLPYRSTSFATLLHAVISMHRRSRIIKDRVNYYHEDITAVLGHPHVRMIAADDAETLTKHIREGRLYNIPADVLVEKAPELAPLFASVRDAGNVHAVADYLDHLLQWLGTRISERAADASPEPSPKAPAEEGFDLKAIKYFREQLAILTDYIVTYHIDMSDNSFFHLFERLFNATGLRLSGTPLRGLQVLGVLETRALDFDNVIVLSMNEGIFPRSRYSRTMIPAALRTGYGLPDFDSAEWTYAYSYYRLLARARNVTLLYDSRVGGV
ncbi:MAG: hypothetical protein K2M55_05970, partial [Muribaculaceae bacterium]|nr:hypothetical protein [Muribaculaceae bacterium]